MSRSRSVCRPKWEGNTVQPLPASLLRVTDPRFVGRILLPPGRDSALHCPRRRAGRQATEPNHVGRTTHPVRTARWDAGRDGAVRRPHLPPGLFGGSVKLRPAPWRPSVFSFIRRPDRGILRHCYAVA